MSKITKVVIDKCVNKPAFPLTHFIILLHMANKSPSCVISAHPPVYSASLGCVSLEQTL